MKVSNIDVLLIGFEDQENLGLRSIVAYLRKLGHRVEMARFAPNNVHVLLEVILASKPRLVGFSLIFQYALEQFHDLMSYLRSNGVRAHFTAGGHFPSLRPEETFKLIPELDSIVRFEGEMTVAELVEKLDMPSQWGSIKGLAYRQGEEVVVNDVRPLIVDLDVLPNVYRDSTWTSSQGIYMASMLASRGCWFNCTFCSIRQFYAGSPGPLRRTRSPSSVVDEMLTLFREHNIRFFSFQDDDFAARTRKQRAWLDEFLGCLSSSFGPQEIGWKISCRVDDLDPSLLERMISCGLMAVYLGIESGSTEGLRVMNKHVSVVQNLAAIELIKRHNLALAIGFMLFDPTSTMDTLRVNLSFLRTVGEDGYFPINFCKMLPFAGTPIEDRLRKAGRLTGTVTHPDYDFCDPRVDLYAFLVQRVFSKRNFSSNGLVTKLQNADFERRIQRALVGSDVTSDIERGMPKLVQRANLAATDALERLLACVAQCGAYTPPAESAALVEIAEAEWRTEAQVEVELHKLIKMSDKSCV